MIFQRLIFSALAVALLVGSLQTGMQQWQAAPIILAAEVYEDQKVEALAAVEQVTAHSHAGTATVPHVHDVKAWTPADGVERTFWTLVANMLHAFSMALLAFVVMGVSLYKGSSLRSMTLALWVAAAGWLTFHFWPSLGLHAEIPGMDAARLGSRQGWWVLAAVSAAFACGSLALLRTHMRWAAAAAWLAFPYIVGAPHIVTDPLAGFSGEAQVALRQLGTQFIWATTWVSLTFWICMGVVTGFVFQRLLRPVVTAMLATSENDSAQGMKVAQ